MNKKNILIILADQLAWRALPVYGDRYAVTPAINSIGENAAVFEQCYTPCPLCQPARASFWSGVYPHETGALSNGMLWPVKPIPESLPTLGDTFRAAGYDTVHFGKKHDAGALRGFTCAPEKQLPVEQEFDTYPLNGDTFVDRHTSKVAVEYLEQKGDGPFLMIADFINPHNICGYIGAFAGAHEDTPIDNLPELPENFEFEDIANRPKAVQYICCSHNRQAQTAEWTPDNFRHYLAAYYYYLSLVDREIAKVLAALRGRTDAENTLIVFMADHGDSMASRGRVTKQVDFYEEVTRVPFVFSGPGVVPGRISGPVSLLDLFPTLCGYAGVASPGGLRGCDLSAALRGGALPQRRCVASEWHTEWGYTVSPARMIVDGSIKYTMFIEDNGEELYDLAADPHEKVNLINHSEYAPVLSRMRELFRQHLAETNDFFLTLEWKADERWRSHAVGYANHSGYAAPEESWKLEGKL